MNEERIELESFTSEEMTIIKQKSFKNEVEIDFFGGEPFLEFPTIKEVCEWVWSNNWRNKYVFFATTNGVVKGSRFLNTHSQEAKKLFKSILKICRSG